MKKLIILTAALFSFMVVKAQWSDTTIAEINFDSSTNYLNYITFDTTQSNNCWQVGIPSKTLFDSAYSPKRAIMTDTISPYPTNDTSSFVFHWTIPYNIYYQPPVGFFVSFYQKTDFENNRDVGIIEYWNPDSAQWYNIDSIFTTNLQPFGISSVNGYTLANNDSSNFYCFALWDATNTVSDLQDSDLKNLPNGETGFTGTDSTWQHIVIFYNHYLPLRIEDPHNKSGMPFKLRFTLISDSVQSGNEGWMIDGFRIVASKEGVGTGIEKYKDKKIVKIFPNPANNSIKLDLSHIHDAENATVQIFDELGRKVKATTFHYNSPNIDISGLDKGLYQIIVRNKDAIIATGRFVKE